MAMISDDVRDRYEVVIGLEVHAQLLTKSKAFSPESSEFGADPNTNVDVVSLAHPGTLPVLNRRVVELTVKMGLATNCRIRRRSTFARKHYFYPDLPKGYQISQFDDPICHDGFVDIDEEGTPLRIGITRIHMEEDAGKSMHDQDPFNSLVDLNRCGVPLIEIVSEPDIRSPRQAYLYLQKIRQIVRYLGICDGNMEEGSLRCDANVSVRPRGQKAFGTKTEVKNMNSFRNVERALTYEVDRQIALIESGGVVVQQTMLWDPNRLETRTMRVKEESHDYRYFPDPDLVQVEVTDELLATVREDFPEMPSVRAARFVSDLGLPSYDAAILTEDRGIADYYEGVLDRLTGREGAAKAASNFVMTDVLRVLNDRSIAIDDFPVSAARLAGLIDLRLNGAVSSTGAQEIFGKLLETDDEAAEIAAAENLLQVSDQSALAPIVEQVLKSNPDKVQAYLDGKDGLIGFFIGQVMRSFQGSPDPQLVRSMLLDRINSEAG
ncbi:MAG TPA: Asp-tRNA(Asn)/Glu-tRNA(Gln) amidotransferase subunit GatB [Rhodothermales bacterium]|nr:Asp-tRNA(Asn)/Glu-tRNA(Gln) amidotransferase subunit GatB [Rhodothermales bacterium]